MNPTIPIICLFLITAGCTSTSTNPALFAPGAGQARPATVEVSKYHETPAPTPTAAIDQPTGPDNEIEDLAWNVTRRPGEQCAGLIKGELNKAAWIEIAQEGSPHIERIYRGAGRIEVAFPCKDGKAIRVLIGDRLVFRGLLK